MSSSYKQRREMDLIKSHVSGRLGGMLCAQYTKGICMAVHRSLLWGHAPLVD